MKLMYYQARELKASKSDNSTNSPRLNFTNIKDLHSTFVGCKPFLESNSFDTVALCLTQTWKIKYILVISLLATPVITFF